MLNVGGVPPSIMSVPIRSQSGVRFAFRIQACRSGDNGVPGMGLGPDKYRKSPLVSRTSGRKK